MENSISDMLQQEFRTRRGARTRYSLRAFARDLGVSPSFLSYILKGQRIPSLDTAVEFSKRIGWSSRDAKLFLRLVQLQNVRESSAKKIFRGEIKGIQQDFMDFRRMKTDQFALIADWYHFAILELIDTESFQSDARWIAEKLGISLAETQSALDRLVRFQQLDIRDGKFCKLHNNSVLDTPSRAIRRFHSQHLKHAQVAMERQAFDRRHMSGMTMAVDPEKLPEAEEMIREFRSKLAKFLEGGKKTSVYHLAIQLFQLDDGGIK